MAAAYGVAFRSLCWKGNKPATAIEESARDARYALLAEASREFGAAWLLTAHHLDDQAETVLMRLARGSGVRGLAAMQTMSRLSTGLVLFRPFLSVPKERLAGVVRTAGVDPREDKTNTDRRFLRARLRQLMPHLATEGLDSARLAMIAEKMGRAAEAVETYSRRLSATAMERRPGEVLVNRALYRSEPVAVRLRALASTLNEVAGVVRPIRDEPLLALDSALCGHAPFRRTLGGVIVGAVDGTATLRQETPRKARRDRYLRAPVTADRKPSLP